MRIPCIAANWKMNTNIAEAIDLVASMKSQLTKFTGVDIVLCPPFVSLDAINKLVDGTSIKTGAQNMYFESKGAYTGEISPYMLQGLCDYVILGHSERRQYFAESDEMINKKIKAAFNSGLTPIICVGETLSENEKGMTETILAKQLISDLDSVEPTKKIVIAYEPVWAIGTGRAATGNQANNTIRFIRSTIARLWNDKASQSIQILYGGSVNEKNIQEFISETDIDGALIGGASLKSDVFIDIISQTLKYKTTR